MQSPLSVFYIPCASQDEALSIAQKLLEEGAIACANLLPGVQSLYLWEGKLQNTSETVLIVKTRSEKKALVSRRLQELHSYDCPCILELELGSINRPFVEWVRSVVAPLSNPAIEPKPTPSPLPASSSADDDRPPWD